MANYKQLTCEQRWQIEALIESGIKQQRMAEIVGVSQSTISRELKRNSGHHGYHAKQADKKSRVRREAVERPSKWDNETIVQVEGKLLKKWSPDEISGWLKKDYGKGLSHESIYQYVWNDKFSGGYFYLYLRREGKKYAKRGRSKTGRGQIKNRVSIDKRPKLINEKKRVGDWEIDTMIGAGQSGALLTIVERKMKFTLSAQLKNKTAEAVAAAAIWLLLPYKDVVHSITSDNGLEFAYHEQISKALDAKFYFANPYHSWERGLNENTNGLLRQYWPKGTNFKLVKQWEVDEAIEELNNRPRKLLNYGTPASLMEKHLLTLK